MHVVGGITGQYPALVALLRKRAAPAVSHRLLQRPGGAVSNHLQLAQRILTDGLQAGGEAFFVAVQPLGHQRLLQRPDHGHFMPFWAAHGQQGQNAFGRKPLAGDAAVGQLAAQARGNRVLGVGGDGELHAKLAARAAGAAFADGGEGGFYRLFDDFDLRLVAHGLGQTLLQCGHIDNPGQRFHILRCGIKLHLAVQIAKDLHADHGCGIFIVGPAAQRLQHGSGTGVQRIGPYILLL